MRYLSIVALVVILAGLLLWIAVSGDDSTAAEGNDLLVAGGTLAAATAACPMTVSKPESLLAAAINFSENSEAVLDPCTLKVKDGKLHVMAGGSTIGVFKLDSNGKMVPAGSQPNGNTIKATYSGPPGDTFSSYRIYPSNYEKGQGIKPLLAIDHNGGQVSVVAAADIVQRNRSDYNNSQNKYGGNGGSNFGGGGCSTGGGGGG